MLYSEFHGCHAGILLKHLIEIMDIREAASQSDHLDVIIGENKASFCFSHAALRDVTVNADPGLFFEEAIHVAGRNINTAAKVLQSQFFIKIVGNIAADGEWAFCR